MLGWIVLGVMMLAGVSVMVGSVRRVSPGTTQIVERLGRYSRTLEPGLNLLLPLIDQVRARVDMREQAVPLPTQSMVTSDGLVVSVDTVVHLQVTQPAAAVYEVADYVQAVEHLTVTTLRNIIGTMDLEQALTIGRDRINGRLFGALDEATGRWGVTVNRAEVTAIEPLPSA